MTDGEGPNPSGLCMCGCGEQTKLATVNCTMWGHVKGAPKRYVYGHGRRKPLTWTVEPKSGCWIWNGAVGAGRGHVQRAGKTTAAYRWVYEREVGPIPEGMILHHRCETPLCVNPEHMEPMTHSDHMAMHSRDRWARLHRYEAMMAELAEEEAAA